MKSDDGCNIPWRQGTVMSPRSSGSNAKELTLVQHKKDQWALFVLGKKLNNSWVKLKIVEWIKRWCKCLPELARPAWGE